MKKLLTNIAAVLTLLLLNTFGLSLRASAMPMGPHEMSGMNHKTSNSATCATLCYTAVIKKDEVVNLESDEEDDEPSVPFYTHIKVCDFSETHVSQKLYAYSVKPPPKVPIHILYSVFRV